MEYDRNTVEQDWDSRSGGADDEGRDSNNAAAVAWAWAVKHPADPCAYAIVAQVSR